MNFDDRGHVTSRDESRGENLLSECLRLIRDERPRYEIQANQFLSGNFNKIIIKDVSITYSKQNGRYTYELTRSTSTEEFVTSQFAIPKTKTAQIEALIELFAQSEATASS